MGLIYAESNLINSGDLILHRRGYLDESEIKQVRVNALVDTQTYSFSINETIRTQLDLPFIEKEIIILADETGVEVDVVGPVEIRFENRRVMVNAIVLPGDAEVLLGTMPIDRMDVLVDPKQQKLVVNPKHPYIMQTYLK